MKLIIPPYRSSLQFNIPVERLKSLETHETHSYHDSCQFRNESQAPERFNIDTNIASDLQLTKK